MIRARPGRGVATPVFAVGSLLLGLFLAACGREPSAGGDEAATDGSRAPTTVTILARAPDGSLEGRLARSWELDPERREWTVHLRTDVRWHDGVPVTAHDVKFTLDLYQHPEVLWRPPNSYEVRVLDDSTYAIRYERLSDPDVPIGAPSDWYYPIYPKHLLEREDPAGFHEWGFWQQPVGNGAYRLVRRVPETALVLAANPDHYRGAPAVDTLVIRIGGSSLIELLAGNVDAIASVPDADLPKLRDDERFELYHAYNPYSISAVFWNHRHSPFDDPRIRRALTMAMDRRGILDFLNAPPDLEPIDVLYSDRQLVRGEVPPGLAYDPEAASALLDQAGWRDEDGDGIREKDNEPFRFSLLVSPTGGAWFPSHEREAVIIQSNLRRVGIEVDIVSVESNIAWQRTSEGEFEAALFDIKPGNRALLFGAESVIGYRNPRVVELLTERRRTLDPAALDRLYAELGEIFREELPVTLLQPMVSWTAAHRRLRGLSSPWRADPGWYMEHLWIEDP
jgi:peptide/nickel transport system substrate-binding protein